MASGCAELHERGSSVLAGSRQIILPVGSRFSRLFSAHAGHRPSHARVSGICGLIRVLWQLSSTQWRMAVVRASRTSGSRRAIYLNAESVLAEVRVKAGRCVVV